MVGYACAVGGVSHRHHTPSRHPSPLACTWQVRCGTARIATCMREWLCAGGSGVVQDGVSARVTTPFASGFFVLFSSISVRTRGIQKKRNLFPTPSRQRCTRRHHRRHALPTSASIHSRYSPTATPTPTSHSAHARGDHARGTGSAYGHGVCRGTRVRVVASQWGATAPPHPTATTLTGTRHAAHAATLTTTGSVRLGSPQQKNTNVEHR